MKSQFLSNAALLASGVFGAREWLNEPDTGIELSLPDLKPGELASIDSVVGLPDFEYVARNYLPIKNYTYYRNGAGGEWVYRHNVEVFQQYAIRSRTMIDITNIEASLPCVSDSFPYCLTYANYQPGPRFSATTSRSPFTSPHSRELTWPMRGRKPTW